jgi:hypothetical protein
LSSSLEDAERAGDRLKASHWHEDVKASTGDWLQPVIRPQITLQPTTQTPKQCLASRKTRP